MSVHRIIFTSCIELSLALGSVASSVFEALGAIQVRSNTIPPPSLHPSLPNTSSRPGWRPIPPKNLSVFPSSNSRIAKGQNLQDQISWDFWLELFAALNEY